jgi:hypothetical protein
VGADPPIGGEHLVIGDARQVGGLGQRQPGNALNTGLGLYRHAYASP